MLPVGGSTFNLSPHATNIAFKPPRKRRQLGSYNDNGITGTRYGNNIYGSGGKIGWWTAPRVMRVGGGEEETVTVLAAMLPLPTPPSSHVGGRGKRNSEDVSGNNAVRVGGQMMQCEQAANNTMIRGGGRQQHATTAGKGQNTVMAINDVVVDSNGDMVENDHCKGRQQPL